MELDEIKKVWKDLSMELENQKLITDKIILQMTKDKYSRRLRSISGPETLGSFICFGFALLVLINLGKLDTWYLLTCGIFTISFCTVMPILSLHVLHKMHHIDLAQKNIKHTLMEFSKAKKQFFQVMKYSLGLCFILLITSMPLSDKIMNDNDSFLQPKTWIWLPVGFLILAFFVRKGYRFYTKTIAAIQNDLEDLDRDLSQITEP